jgi:hypothetical protein
MLAHQTPPSFVIPNVLSATEIFLQNIGFVKELPSLCFVRSCRTVLLHVSKTLAAYEIGSANWFEQLFTDGTSRRQTPIQNLVIKILDDGDYMIISLSMCIIAEEENAESLTTCIVQAFKESASLLDDWQMVTTKIYPNCQDLINLIPEGSKLTL